MPQKLMLIPKSRQDGDLFGGEWIVWRRYRGCGIKKAHYGGLRLMGPKIVRVGEYFINIGNLLWAQATPSATDPDVQLLLLTFGAGEPPLQLTLSDSDAMKLIHLLDSMSQEL